MLIENSFNTGTNAVWTDAQSLYQTHTLIALESLARGPDVEALLNFAASNGVLVQLEPTPCLAIWATIRLAGPNGDDHVSGGAENDALFGEMGADAPRGDAGNDKLYGWSENDILYGGAENDALWGDAGNDWLRGDSGVDRLFGGIGNDILHGVAGNDLLYGGSVRDIFVFAGASGRVRILDFEQGRDRIDLSAYDATWAKVRGALSLMGGIVQLDLGKIGGSGLLSFADEQKLSLFSAADFILSEISLCGCRSQRRAAQRGIGDARSAEPWPQGWPHSRPRQSQPALGPKSGLRPNLPSPHALCIPPAHHLLQGRGHGCAGRGNWAKARGGYLASCPRTVPQNRGTVCA